MYFWDLHLSVKLWTTNHPVSTSIIGFRLELETWLPKLQATHKVVKWTVQPKLIILPSFIQHHVVLNLNDLWNTIFYFFFILKNVDNWTVLVTTDFNHSNIYLAKNSVDFMSNVTVYQIEINISQNSLLHKRYKWREINQWINWRTFTTVWTNQFTTMNWTFQSCILHNRYKI